MFSVVLVCLSLCAANFLPGCQALTLRPDRPPIGDSNPDGLDPVQHYQKKSRLFLQWLAQKEQKLDQSTGELERCETEKLLRWRRWFKKHEYVIGAELWSEGEAKILESIGRRKRIIEGRLKTLTTKKLLQDVAEVNVTPQEEEKSLILAIKAKIIVDRATSQLEKDDKLCAEEKILRLRAGIYGGAPVHSTDIQSQAAKHAWEGEVAGLKVKGASAELDERRNLLDVAVAAPETETETTMVAAGRETKEPARELKGILKPPSKPKPYRLKASSDAADSRTAGQKGNVTFDEQDLILSNERDILSKERSRDRRLAKRQRGTR